MSYPTRKNQILACIGAWSKFLFSSVFIHAVCGNFSAAQCTKSGPNDGSTFVTDNSNGGVYNYTNPSNAQLSDNNRANAASIAGIFTRKTYYLQVTGFNFNVFLPPQLFVEWKSRYKKEQAVCYQLQRSMMMKLNL